MTCTIVHALSPRGGNWGGGISLPWWGEEMLFCWGVWHGGIFLGFSLLPSGSAGGEERRVIGGVAGCLVMTGVQTCCGVCCFAFRFFFSFFDPPEDDEFWLLCRL